MLEAMAIRLEAIAIRLEAMAIRLEAIAIRLEAIASRLEAIASRLEAIASRLEAIAIRLEAMAIRSEPLLLGRLNRRNLRTESVGVQRRATAKQALRLRSRGPGGAITLQFPQGFLQVAPLLQRHSMFLLHAFPHLIRR